MLLLDKKPISMFAKHMLQGKVNAALRLLDEETSTVVLSLDQIILLDLKSKHPTSKDNNELL